MTSILRFNPGPHYWEVSTLSTALFLPLVLFHTFLLYESQYPGDLQSLITRMYLSRERMWDRLRQEQHGLKHKDILILIQTADKHLQVLE